MHTLRYMPSAAVQYMPQEAYAGCNSRRAHSEGESLREGGTGHCWAKPADPRPGGSSSFIEELVIGAPHFPHVMDTIPWPNFFIGGSAQIT